VITYLSLHFSYDPANKGPGGERAQAPAVATRGPGGSMNMNQQSGAVTGRYNAQTHAATGEYIPLSISRTQLTKISWGRRTSVRFYAPPRR